MVTAPPTAARHALILRFLVVLQPLLIIPAVPALWLYASSCERLAGSGPTTVVFTAAGDRQEANNAGGGVRWSPAAPHVPAYRSRSESPPHAAAAGRCPGGG